MEGIHYLGEMSRATKLQIKASNGEKLTKEEEDFLDKEAQNESEKY